MSPAPDTTGLCLAAHSYTGMAPGPRLIVTGAVHGNETCGTQAIRRVVADLEAGRLAIARGSLTFVPVANPLAHRHRRRDGERNLNRRLFPTAVPRDFEDRVANWLCPLLARHDVLLDLHSFHTPGEPFVMLGPLDNSGALEPFARAAEERALARHLGVRRFVDGWLDTYARGVARRTAAAAGAPTTLETDPRYGVGTTEYMRSVGGYGVTLECGQHDEAAAPEVARRAILAALAFLRLADDLPEPEPVADPQGLRLFEVVDKHDAGDAFVREWPSFTPLAAGERIGTRADGTAVRAPEDCFIVFPNPAAAAGQEWYYLARRCEMF
jgi:succinylglutamate desuccinylase